MSFVVSVLVILCKLLILINGMLSLTSSDNLKAPGHDLLYEDKGHTQISKHCHINWAVSLVYKRSTTKYYVFIKENSV